MAKKMKMKFKNKKFDVEEQIKLFKDDKVGLEDIKSKIRMVLQNSFYSCKEELNNLISVKNAKERIMKWTESDESKFVILKEAYEEPLKEGKELVENLEKINSKKSLITFWNKLKKEYKETNT